MSFSRTVPLYVSNRGLCARRFGFHSRLFRGGVLFVPGPLTFRMIDRVWSSMNSTRTWVTPPREPVAQQREVSHRPGVCDCALAATSEKGLRTGPSQDAGDLDELHWLLRSIHFEICEFLVL